MIAHALNIVIHELNNHLTDSSVPPVKVGNVAEVVLSGTGREGVCVSVVNIKEEKTLKNTPTYLRDEASLKTVYHNPPVFLNFLILITATHTDYNSALLMLSRVIRFFQFRNSFDQESVAPESMNGAEDNGDKLESFKLIFDLYSPTLEEVNHLWGTLGGKQYPFVLYVMRMLELKYEARQSEGSLVTEVRRNFCHR